MIDESGVGIPLAADMKVIVGKERFLRDLGAVQIVLTEYERFLRDPPPEAGWEERAFDLAREHHARLRRAQATLQTMELLAAVLRHALARVSSDPLRFRLPEGGADGAPAGAEGPDAAARLDQLSLLVSELHALVQQAPLVMQEKLRIILASFSNLFGGLIAGEPLQVEEAVEQINLLTSSRESQNLIREIAFIAREVYNTLDAFSSELPLQELNESAKGISEAVRKLNSVIQRLDQAANQNLDALEAHLRRTDQDANAMEEVLAALRESQERLGKVKLGQPALAGALSRLQDQLGDGIGSLVMLLRNRAEANRESLISMTANQSFQDLTGQTLKKIIGFIETLQLQIVRMLEKYRPVLGLTASKPGPEARAEESLPRQSQDQVDALLADLGF